MKKKNEKSNKTKEQQVAKTVKTIKKKKDVDIKPENVEEFVSRIGGPGNLKHYEP